SVRSNERTGDAARRVSNSATVQAAVARIQYAFQNDLGSELDYYTLDADDLRSVTQQPGSTSRVLEPAALGLPSVLATVGKVYEHVPAPDGTSRLSQVPQVQPATVVEERIPVDPAVCRASGLPAANCTSDVRAYWQVYETITPDTTGSEPPNVVLYLRTWLGSGRNYSRPSYARAELRPGRFADFQQISDGNVNIGAGASINGPVHSNGLADGSFSTVEEAPAGAVNGDARWIYVNPGATCSGSASLSITKGTIAAGGCPSVGATGQTISFLRVTDSVQTIRTAAAAGRPGVRTFTAPASRRGGENMFEAYATAWRVQLQGNSMSVQYPDGTGAGTYPLGRVNAFVFDEDVRVHGTAARDVRVTIAAERPNGGAASIYVDGDIIKGDDRLSSIGLIAQGDVVMWMQSTGGVASCPVRKLQAAIVAASGGLTIPTKYATDEVQTLAPDCGGNVLVDGSVAGHRPPLMVWRWDGFGAGYTGTRTYRWDEALKRNPPPFFPLTGTWQPYQVREANVDCLFDPARIMDPECR
ncbi:MAG: hypothetical protein JWM98_1766, partial [Thermoleophilia bacterium]|nr:hypothetical protein [Thermoleophilia bacterium]